MKKYQSPSGYYELIIPDNWNYSEDDNIISFYDEVNGVGALQISSYLISKEQHIDLASELAEMVADKTKLSRDQILLSISVFKDMAYCYVTKENTYWVFYMLFKNGKLLFLTYNCDQSDKNIEEDIIDKIVKSIKIGNVSE